MLRLVVLLNAIGLNLYRAGNFRHPVLGVVCVGVMVLWTAVALPAYASSYRRTPLLLGADLAVATALLLITPVVKGADFNATVPGFWIMGALLAWAIHLRWVGGLVAGLLLAVVDLALRADITQNNYGNVFLLVIGGPIVGYVCGSLQVMAAARDRAERQAAAQAERARLARVVHDGVLQVLALVQRRASELGPDGAELGELAGEQEAALRRLIRAQARPAEPVGPADSVDLVALLSALEARPGVQVAVPATPVELPPSRATELVAAVAACLDNVARHVGEGAPAWVLLEVWPDRVEVSVRDEGPGIASGRLEQAVADGRLGVCESIRGRIEDLGGTAALDSDGYGTEWLLSVPRGDA